MMERIDYGGTLLNLVLEEIAGNFQDTADDLAILTELFDAEREALTRGLIQSDFAVLVTRPVGSAHHEFDGVASSLD